MRIISLLPSGTEVVVALDLESHLVGISHECDFPRRIVNRRVVTRSIVDSENSSRGIDDAIRRASYQALSVYEVDERALVELQPDIIVTQDLCQVCAVSLDDVQLAVSRALGGRNVSIVSLRPTRLDHVFEDIQRLAIVFDQVRRGATLVHKLQGRISAVAERSAAIGFRPRVVSVEWIDPLMLGGTWMPELIEFAGGIAVGVNVGQAAPTIEPAELAKLDPDVVVFKPCGFGLQRTLRERAWIEAQILAHLKPETRVYISDGNAYFNRPGPRLVESLEILAACIHPQDFADLAQKHREVMHRLAP